MNVSAYPLPNRSDMMSALRTMQANEPDNPQVKNAARCLDEFRAESGEQMHSDVAAALGNIGLRKAGGLVAGAVLAAVGLATGFGVIGVLGGVAVAAATNHCANKRAESLQSFGVFMGVVNILQVAEGKFDQHEVQAAQAPPAEPKAEPKVTFVEAEPMPKGWKRPERPKTDVVIDTVYDPRSGSHVAHSITEYARPEPPPEPKTVTVIDMQPNAQGTYQMSGITDYRV